MKTHTNVFIYKFFIYIKNDALKTSWLKCLLTRKLFDVTIEVIVIF